MLLPGSYFERKEKIGKLRLEVCALTDGSVAALDFRNQFAIRDARIAVLEQLYASLIKCLALTLRNHGALRMELDWTRPAIG